ncbi:MULTISPECIES: type I restriction-modification system subunit M [Stenotrophomonas maltophilia group]|uniref:site-specific DNA-methyltransferase (adenine-specific) n=2 Tax=Bacteria TaxID=2 RepID=A0ABQ6Q8L4_9GAMM|nr:N-6 DNA methylase [Stenotrophomonas maltophilia]MCU1156926.1 N-6 DNA methylase [Stenotrophomonas maltophilia]GMR26033.1 type I restriction-modification system subunit M [Stenotrophomonas sepilia]
MNRDQLKKLENDLWSAADKLRANSDLKASEYSTPVLGLIFLKFADNKYRQHQAAIEQEFKKLQGTRRERTLEEIAIEKCGFYLDAKARYDYLLNLPEKENIAKAIRAAMASIENTKPELLGVLPQEEYDRFTRSPKNQHIPKDLLKLFSDIPVDATGDVFGQIYEYFLANFALSEGQGGGEFFTPRSVVKLMTEIIEPHGGKVFDPACGSGGMFVQSADFILQHQADKAADLDVFVCGTEKTLETVKLAKMNLAVNNLRGDIKQANTYYEDPFNAFGAFDYVMANPPFNVDDVTLDAVEKDRRFNTYGVPRNKTKAKAAAGKDGKEKAVETVPNGNYLWINLFATSLKEGGRAALVMANSASDARHSEADIRRTLIEQNLIYGMLTLPSNLFYTVTLPATLWFFDKGKTDDKVLFIDARNIFTQVDRAHRELSDEQIQNIALIPRLHKGRRQEFVDQVDRYLHQGMAQLKEAAEHLPALSDRLLAVLAEEAADTQTSQAAREAVAALQAQWGQLVALALAQDQHERTRGQKHSVEERNQAQHLLRAQFAPFFTGQHAAVKALDKAIREMDKRKAEAAKLEGKRATANRQTKGVKAAVQALHDELKAAELYYQHVSWLQERFPKAAYEDVTGLCKLASREEIAEKDWSLNPGRYVGVVIEEDGKTEEEFLADLQASMDVLDELDGAALRLKAVIDANLKTICEAG